MIDPIVAPPNMPSNIEGIMCGPYLDYTMIHDVEGKDAEPCMAG